MIIFVTATYNEQKNIGRLLQRTKEKAEGQGLDYKIIVVNDGSTDDTERVVKSLMERIPLYLHSYYPNKGAGEAFRLGFRKALEIGEAGDIIVTKEADNTSDLGTLAELISKIRDGYDVALASCFAKGGRILGVSPLRLILSRGANILLKVFFPIKDVNTYTSFYRAYRYEALKEIFDIYGDALIEESGFECMPELLIKFSRNVKFKIAEVPTILDVNKRIGKSKMRIFKTIKGVLRIILREGIIYRIKKRFKDEDN